MGGVDGAADVAENALLFLRNGGGRELFAENGADKGFQFLLYSLMCSHVNGRHSSLCNSHILLDAAAANPEAGY